MKVAEMCELCDLKAVLYCASDSAFLCWSCDKRVHCANFLVTRHVRHPICCECNVVDLKFFSGTVIQPFVRICRSCKFDQSCYGDDVDSTSCSDCVSSNESSSVKSNVVTENSGIYSFTSRLFSEGNKKGNKRSLPPPRVKEWDEKAESNVMSWCKMFGLKTVLTAQVTIHVSGTCLPALATFPYKVALASSFWYSLKLYSKGSESTGRNLERLEQVSGVSCRVIVRGEDELARVFRDKKMWHDGAEEGWGESSD